ncbi:MAG TPA: hypothetical protein VGR65_00555 [Casimicrobiaceae bacterium]|nr:hypothetical protein [Casimicrobiaceae bacterium]
MAESELPLVYFFGGLATLVTAQVIGFLADRYGKHRLFTIVALASLAPIFIITHLSRLPLAQAVVWSTLFFVLVTGRFGPAMAIVSSSAEPRLRGSFMSRCCACCSHAGSGSSPTPRRSALVTRRLAVYGTCA